MKLEELRGSVARGDSSASSGIEILVDLDPGECARTSAPGGRSAVTDDRERLEDILKAADCSSLPNA
jgi:predicted nucleotidyltransferase